MTGFVRVITSVVVLLLTACSVNLSKDSGGEFARNECKSDSDCGSGACRSGACVAHQGTLDTLLLETLPPLAVPGVGGVRFLQVEVGLALSNDDTKIELSPTTIVHGFVRARDGACADPVPTFPVHVTLTPREESYGLQTATYVAQTTQTVLSKGHPCVGTAMGQVPEGTSVNEFVVALPGGTSSYDVYVEPSAGTNADAGTPGACTMVPQLFRNLPVAECFTIPPSTPQTLDVVIPWPNTATDSLEGWTLDVVQPITGHVLSDRLVLRANDWRPTVAGPGYERDDLRYAKVLGDEPGKELVRLSPPGNGPRATGPVIQAELSGLQATNATKAIFPVLGVFPTPVTLESWVYKRDSPGSDPVPGNVTLTATKLYGIKAGIFASFSTTGVVGEDGKLSALVLPGTYRARVVPRAGLGLAASEMTLDVALDPAHPIRAGKELRVARAAEVTGNVVDAVAQVPVDRASVQAVASAFGVRQCPKGADAAACAAEPLGVLELSLGEDAFVPRSVSAVTNHGAFTLKEVDCGGCSQGRTLDAGTEQPGASFDISVRPPDGSRFAWFLRPSVMVDGGEVPLGSLPLPLPIIHRGVVEITQPEGALPVSSALIKAYVMRDEHGVVIDEPAGLSSCAAGTPGVPVRCIRSVLQVAETRAAEDGTFELVIPSVIP